MTYKNMLSKPHSILWLGAVLFIIIGFFSNILSQDAIEIQLHDTYFVIAHFHLWAGPACFLGLLGLLYWLMDWIDFKLWAILSYLHIFITLSTLLAITAILIYITLNPDKTRYHLVYESSFFNLSFVFIYLLLLFVLSQLLFLLGVIIGIIHKAIS